MNRLKISEGVISLLQILWYCIRQWIYWDFTTKTGCFCGSTILNFIYFHVSLTKYERKSFNTR